MRVYGYLRASSKDQDALRAKESLIEFVKKLKITEYVWFPNSVFGDVFIIFLMALNELIQNFQTKAGIGKDFEKNNGKINIGNKPVFLFLMVRLNEGFCRVRVKSEKTE